MLADAVLFDELLFLVELPFFAEARLAEARLADARLEEARAELLRRELDPRLARWALGTSCFTTSFVS